MTVVSMRGSCPLHSYWIHEYMFTSIQHTHTSLSVPRPHSLSLCIFQSVLHSDLTCAVLKMLLVQPGETAVVIFDIKVTRVLIQMLNCFQINIKGCMSERGYYLIQELPCLQSLIHMWKYVKLHKPNVTSLFNCLQFFSVTIWIPNTCAVHDVSVTEKTNIPDDDATERHSTFSRDIQSTDRWSE